MAKHCCLILCCLVLIFIAGEQPRNNINCQANLIEVKTNCKASKRNSNKCRIIKHHWPQNSRSLKFKSNKSTSSSSRTTVAAKTLDAFNLRASQANHSSALKIKKILQELSLTIPKSIKEHSLKVDTLVLFGFSETIFNSWEIFPQNRKPLLIIKNKINWQLRDIYNNNNILSIIFLRAEYPSANELLITLKQTLKGMHLNKIIIIKEPSIVAENQDDLQILNWLHINGFWQSLLVDLEGGTSLTLQHLTGKFIRNLTIEDFLLQTTNWHNLLQFPITCAMASNPPRAYIQYDSERTITLKGFYGTIIKIFVEHYNASFKPFVLSELDFYTEMDCVEYIKARKVDICSDALPMHEQYSYVITYPEEIVASYLMVPYDKPLPRFHYFLKPFQLNVWTIVTISFCYKVITLALIHRLQQGTWNVSLQLLYALLSVLYLPFQLTHIKRPYRRVLEILMILVGFVVANWYLSVLSSLLFTRLYFHDIKDLQDLVEHNISIMVDEFELYLLNASVNDPILMQQLKVVSSEILLQHRRNLDPHYAYYSQYDKVAFYLHQQKFLLRPRLKVLTGIPPINEVLSGIPMRPNWPFHQLLNNFMGRLIDSGLIQRIYTNALDEGIQSGYLHYFPTEYHYVEPISIEYFQMPAMLLAVGYSLAFVAFILELWVFKRN